MASVDSRQTKHGLRWRVRWPENGKVEPATFLDEVSANAFARRVEANGGRGLELLRQMELQRLGMALAIPEARQPEPPDDGAAPSEKDRSQMTIKELVYEYCANGKKGNDKTKKYDLRDYENHIDPYIGQLVVKTTSANDLKTQWQDKLLEKTRKIPPGKKKPVMARKSVKNYRGSILAPAFDYACRMGFNGEPPIRGDNPCKLLPSIEVNPSVKTRLRSPREVRIFCSSAYELSEAWGDFVSAKLAGGFRTGEAYRLKPKATLPENKSVFVWEVRRIDENEEVTVVVDAKTIAGFGREVPIATPVWNAIFLPAIQKGRSHRESLILGNPKGEMWADQTTRTLWRKTIEIAAGHGVHKEGMTIRHLRDSMAAWYQRQGFNGIPLKKVLGHKINDVTTDYGGHELMEIERLQALAAAELFFAEWRRG